MRDRAPKTLPDRPDLVQLRRRAKELRNSVAAGDPQATARVSAVSDLQTLAAAQLALAREYGFPSWPRLVVEVERKALISAGDVAGLRRLLQAHPQLATDWVRSSLSGPSSSALGYVGVARFHGSLDHDKSEEITRALLDAGASPNGAADQGESPLITAASYGEIGMARALVEAGADLEAVGYAVPGGTALAHAVEFGSTEIVDVLVRAGAVIHDLAEAAGAGRLDLFPVEGAQPELRARSLRAAAVCQRLEVIDELVKTGTPVDVDLGDGATPLHWAAYHGKPIVVRHLLRIGADPAVRDRSYQATPLGYCQHRSGELRRFGQQTAGYDEVERVLATGAHEEPSGSR